MPTIVDVIQNDDNFKTLSALLKDSGLFSTLGEASYTLFAPSDDAFNKLPEGTVDDLLRNRDALTELLEHHAVQGKVTRSSLTNVDALTMLSGRDVEVSARDGQFSVGRASVIKADVMADNGAVHVIDQVLSPL